MECGKHRLESVLNTGVWKMRSVQDTKCRHCGVCHLVGCCVSFIYGEGETRETPPQSTC